MPAQFRVPSGGGSPQALFDPANLARMKQALPPAAAPLFDQVIHATRVALAMTLRELFLIAAVILVIALLATFFLREVPLTKSQKARDAAARQGEPVTV